MMFHSHLRCPHDESGQIEKKRRFLKGQGSPIMPNHIEAHLHIGLHQEVYICLNNLEAT